MIKISKGDAPKELVDSCKPLVDAYEAAYDAAPGSYAAKGFDISEDYKMNIVKTTLKDRQHNKCCFSEAKFLGDYPHVEHFRPKSRVDMVNSKTRLYPGYYWLAYEWTNLFYCKQVINTSYKKNFFPLVDETQRNRNHHDTYVEQSVFINPGKEDENPRDHIQFYKDEVSPVTERGLLNINYLGLRHSDFVEARAKRYNELVGLKELVEICIAEGIDISNPVMAANIATLKAAMLPNAEFSSMAIDLLSNWPHL